MCQDVRNLYWKKYKRNVSRFFANQEFKCHVNFSFKLRHKLCLETTAATAVHNKFIVENSYMKELITLDCIKKTAVAPVQPHLNQ